MPLSLLDSGSCEGVESDPDRVFGFTWLRKNAKAFAEEFANREIERAPELVFAHAHAAYSRKSERAHLLAIDFYLRGAPLPVTKQTAAKLALTTWGLLGVPRR